MQATIHNASEFKKLLDVVGSFDPQFNIKCSKDGIRFSCMDTARTSVINATLPTDYFQSYAYSADTGQIELGVKADCIKSLFKSAGKKDVLHLNKAAKSDFLSLQFDGADRQTTWDMKLMDIITDELSIPDLDANIECSIASSYLSDWQKRYTNITGTALEFAPFPDKMILTSAGDVGKVTTTICSNDQFSVVKFDGPKPVSLSPHSISLASKVCDLSSECDIFWSNGAPVGVKTTFGCSGTICMYFAPVMADEEDMEE